ncbi:hypothetical protein BJV74DRAFT_835638 [Russula compacta]|nr:hypothetical protein BJV74DRAFT_835638 [Russula compacta]
MSSGAPSTSSHLSYPAPQSEPSSFTPLVPPSPPRELLKNRLYVGNLHPTVDEYTLIQIFSKFGKLVRLDYLFHKTGALRGKPRGYAFVEYASDADAAAALAAANGKLLRGRHITVTYAQQAPADAYLGPSAPRRAPHQAAQHQHGDVGRPTTLSLLKTVPTTRSRYAQKTKTDDKIAQMEAKLQQLAQAPPTGTQLPAPVHPSLPMKPGTRPQSTAPAPSKAAPGLAPVPAPRVKPPLPRASRPPSPPPVVASSVLRNTAPSRKSNAGLLKGVKIVRRKDKTKVDGTGEGPS